MHLARLPALLAAAALIVSACSGGGATPAPTQAPTAAPSAAATAAGEENAIAIRDFAFNPGDLVTTGGKVTWTNADDAPHTVTFDDSSLQSSGNLAKGQTFSATFAGTATYSYKCTIHPSMTGKITVK